MDDSEGAVTTASEWFASFSRLISGISSILGWLMWEQIETIRQVGGMEETVNSQWQFRWTWLPLTEERQRQAPFFLSDCPQRKTKETESINNEAVITSHDGRWWNDEL